MIIYDTISIEENEILYGESKRLVIWVRGCILHCTNCTSQHLWSKDGGKKISAKKLAAMCISNNDLHGITLHGGEPMEQSVELLNAVKMISQAGKSIICFTGYEIEELTKSSQKEMIKHCDILISGRYIDDERNLFLQFRGSNNQKVTFHTQRYKDYKLKDGNNVSIVEIDNDGNVICKGFPSSEVYEIIDAVSKKATS